MLQLVPKWLKSPVYGLVRICVWARLNWCPLKNESAEWWAGVAKRYPAIFDGETFAEWQTVEDGLTMNLGVVDHIERHLRTEGIWDRPVSDVLRAVLKPGSQFLDIGANIGYFTLMGSKLVGDDGLVVAIEPSTRALRKLTANLHRNRCGNVLLLSLGAGVTPERVRLTLATENNIGGSAILANGSTGAYEHIPVVPLGPLLRQLDVSPDLIKIDVEGFELFALRGVFADSDFRPAVVCEVTSEFLARNGQSTTELFQFMKELGYTPYRLVSQAGKTRLEELPVSEELNQESQFDALFLHESQSPPLPILTEEKVA
ncbi:MAG: FkbM family methyltransferase [Planctomycetaceae bacterium]